MKTQTIPFKLVGGHVLLELDGITTFLDTGSQVSFGEVPSLTVLGEVHPLSPRLLGRPSATDVRDGLRRFAPVPDSFDFQALLGLDILTRTKLKLDWERKELTINREPRTSKARRGPVDLPRKTLLVEGRRASAILDTGAWRSYLHSDLAAGLPKLGAFQDYNPIIGGLTAGIVQARIRLGGRNASLAVGVAPPGLEVILEVLGVQVIVGNDLLAGTRASTITIT